MNRLPKLVFFGLALIPVGLVAQEASEATGIKLGRMYIRPEASVQEAYDNRVLSDGNGKATSDFYTDTAVAASLKNQPARYNLSAKAGYGYRFYSENILQNDNFYHAGAAVSSDQNPFQWGVSSELEKTLNYNNYYDPATGTGPGSILTNAPNRRTVTRGSIAYERALTEKTSIKPGFDALHYYQDFQDGGTAEWQAYDAGVQIRYKKSAKTLLTLGGMYGLQINDDENGYIGTVTVGIENSISDTLVWRASIGISAADYQVSGSDQSGIGDLRISYTPNDAVSAYAFGGNEFQPGYGGEPARMVYRAGYGADWRFVPRLILGGQVLHDYERDVGSSNSSTYGGVRHFFTVQCGYEMTKKFLLSVSGSFVNDEEPQNQTVVALKLSYKY